MSNAYKLSPAELEKIEADNRDLIKLTAVPVAPIDLSNSDSRIRASAESVAMSVINRYGDGAEVMFANIFRSAQVLSLQPGTTKNVNGKTYTLNQNHRWTVIKDSSQPPSGDPGSATPSEATTARPFVPLDMAVVEDSGFGHTPPPFPQTLLTRDARRWYLHQETLIHSNIDPTLPPEQKAKKAFTLRNHVREKARRLMHDVDTAKSLDENEKHMSFEGLVARKKIKYGVTEVNEIYEAIYDSANKSRASVNESLNL